MKSKNSIRKDAIRAVPCPHCHAPVGVQCFGKASTRVSVHKSRLDAARKLAKTPKMTINAGEFYASWQWKEARYAALKRHGRRCGCCGWTPGMPGENFLVVDHIKPLRTHPQLALDPKNHQVLCNDCNMGKSYKHSDDFRG
jgi:hypothetical protein